MATSSASTSTDASVFSLAPSDLTFLLHECLRCFWFKVVRGQRRPPSPMPGVFTRMDAGQRAYFQGRSTREVSSLLPEGKLDCRDLRVLSSPLEVPGKSSKVRFQGAMDALGQFDGGGFAAIDFKTARPRESGVPYSLQLHAYALALENAEWPRKKMAPVTHMGLLYFDPTQLVAGERGLAFDLDVTWSPVKRDDAWFLKFLAFAVDVLERPKAPLASPSCGFCKWTGFRD